jgi:hypothetical protein
MKVNTHLKEELRNPDQIRKIVKQRDNMKMKNMEKGKRTKIEAMNRRKKNAGGSFGSRGGGGRSSGGKNGGGAYRGNSGKGRKTGGKSR